MATGELYEVRLTHSVIGAFFEVYNHLGFGFSERIYANALEFELKSRAHDVRREVSFPVYYKGHWVGDHRLDMVVDSKLIVENKSSYQLKRENAQQVYNYVSASRLKVGLLLHFGPRPKVFRFVDRNV